MEKESTWKMELREIEGQVFDDIKTFVGKRFNCLKVETSRNGLLSNFPSNSEMRGLIYAQMLKKQSIFSSNALQESNYFPNIANN